MKIIASYNIKGGVGKTASAVNLSFCAASEGYRTLLWDLDPQGAASFYFRVRNKVKGGSKKLVRGRKALLNLVKGTDFDNLDLLPADFSYRHMDLHLGKHRNSRRVIDELVGPLSDEYDLLFLDCPPSISLVTENVLFASDVVVVPLIPTTLSVRTLDQIRVFLSKNKLKKTKILPFFSMVDRRRAMHREFMSTLQDTYPNLLEAFVPYSAHVERMGLHRAPLSSYAHGSTVARAYESLWGEIRANVKLEG